MSAPERPAPPPRPSRSRAAPRRAGRTPAGRRPARPTAGGWHDPGLSGPPAAPGRGSRPGRRPAPGRRTPGRRQAGGPTRRRRPAAPPVRLPAAAAAPVEPRRDRAAGRSRCGWPAGSSRTCPTRRAAVDAALVDFAARDHRNDVSVALARVVDFVDRPLLLNWVALATVLGAAALGRFRRAFVQLGVDPAGALAGRHARHPARPSRCRTTSRCSAAGPATRRPRCRWRTSPRCWSARPTASSPGPGPDRRAGRGRRADRAFAAAKAVLGVNFPTSVLAGGALGALVAVLGFTLLVPDAVYPLAAAAPGPRTSTWTSAGRRSSRRWPPSSACGCAS